MIIHKRSGLFKRRRRKKERKRKNSIQFPPKKQLSCKKCFEMSFCFDAVVAVASSYKAETLKPGAKKQQKKNIPLWLNHSSNESMKGEA